MLNKAVFVLDAYEEEELYLHVFSVSAPVGEWSDSRSDRFTMKEALPIIHLLGEWVGRIIGLNGKTISLPGIQSRFLGHPVCILLVISAVSYRTACPYMP